MDRRVHHTRRDPPIQHRRQDDSNQHKFILRHRSHILCSDRRENKRRLVRRQTIQKTRRYTRGKTPRDRNIKKIKHVRRNKTSDDVPRGSDTLRRVPQINKQTKAIRDRGNAGTRPRDNRRTPGNPGNKHKPIQRRTKRETPGDTQLRWDPAERDIPQRTNHTHTLVKVLRRTETYKNN